MTTLRALRSAPLDLFCLDGSPFFSDPFGRDTDSPQAWSVQLPPGWTRQITREWTYLEPDRPLSEQGWKVHVAATAHTAELVLHTTAEYCLDRGMHFKHLTTPQVLELMNSKYAARHASGKFITIYPPDHRSLMHTLQTLDDRLGGLGGPYILSDHRWNQGPLHLRYGAFRRFYTTDELGHQVLALRRPNGTLVTDERTPAFSTPEWVVLEPELRQAFEVPDDGARLNYNVIEALHFSNGGGVYRAQDHRTGTLCVLKEGRPYAGLDGRGLDAPTRLIREAQAMQQIGPMPGVPQLVEQFTAWEHFFVALEQVPGTSLRQWVAEHSPDIRPEAGFQARRDYGRRCETILERLAAVLDRLHSAGWIHGDVHPSNVMVDENLQVTLLDFEQTCRVNDPQVAGLGAQGFTRPGHGRTPLSVEDDRYAMGAIALWFFTPLVRMMDRRPRIVRRLIRDAQQRFGLSTDWHQLVRSCLENQVRHAHWITDCWSEQDARTPETQDLRHDLLRALRHRMEQVSQDDNCGTAQPASPVFPGDVHQILTDGGNLSSGDAGVLYALQSAGEQVPGWVLDRLARQAKRMRHPGLLCGLAGPALVLGRAGRDDQAGALLNQACAIAWDRPDMTLATGSAGLALALLAPESGQGETGIHAALKLAQRFQEGRVHRASTVSGEAAGWAEGRTGAAIVCARLARITGESSWADRAEQLYRKDLACTRVVDGMRMVDEDGILYPYLAHGAAGLAVAAAELSLAGRAPVPALVQELLLALSVHSTAEPGLYDGSLGLAAALQHLAVCGLPVYRSDLDRHLRSSGDFAVLVDKGQAMAGRGLRALSFDLSTGSAGWLSVADAVTANISPLPAHQPLGLEVLHHV